MREDTARTNLDADLDELVDHVVVAAAVALLLLLVRALRAARRPAVRAARAAAAHAPAAVAAGRVRARRAARRLRAARVRVVLRPLRDAVRLLRGDGRHRRRLLLLRVRVQVVVVELGHARALARLGVRRRWGRCVVEREPVDLRAELAVRVRARRLAHGQALRRPTRQRSRGARARGRGACDARAGRQARDPLLAVRGDVERGLVAAQARARGRAVVGLCGRASARAAAGAKGGDVLSGMRDGSLFCIGPVSTNAPDMFWPCARRVAPVNVVNASVESAAATSLALPR
jgi:hypothetical protein